MGCAVLSIAFVIGSLAVDKWATDRNGDIEYGYKNVRIDGERNRSYDNLREEICKRDGVLADTDVDPTSECMAWDRLESTGEGVFVLSILAIIVAAGGIGLTFKASRIGGWLLLLAGTMLYCALLLWVSLGHRRIIPSDYRNPNDVLAVSDSFILAALGGGFLIVAGAASLEGNKGESDKQA